MTITEFEQIYHDLFNKLCNKSYKMINDKDAAKDIVQEVFFRLWNKKDSLELNSTTAYLYKSVINETLNYLDKNKRCSRIIEMPIVKEISDGQSAVTTLQYNELQERIDLLLNQLPTKCRRVFMLSRFENMTYKEIALFLGISENTVDNHIKKALALFRKVLLVIVVLICTALFFKYNLG